MDESLAARLVVAARERASEYDWTVVVHRLVGLYERAAGSASPSIR
jgi:hypothetical protein